MVLPIEFVIAAIKPWIIFILYRFCSSLSFSLFPEQQKLNKSLALEILAVLKATSCNPVYSQHMINCGLNLLLSFKWDIDLSLTVILRQRGVGVGMLIVSVGLKTDEGTCPANKHFFLVYKWANACALGRLQHSPTQYGFICLFSFLFCFPMHIYLYLCYSVWNEVSLPMGVLILLQQMYIQCEMCCCFLLRSAVLCMKWQNASWIVTAVLQIWV